MRVGNVPLGVVTLVVLTAVTFLWMYVDRRRRKDAVVFSDPELLSLVAPAPWRRWVAPLVVMLTGLLLVGAAARIEVPQAGSEERTQAVLVLDVSGSMAATDVFPSRMEALQYAAKEFVRLAPREVAIGLVTFSDAADPLVPPTVNREVLNTAIDNLAPLGGTAVGEGILVGLGMLDTDGWKDVDGTFIQQRIGTLIVLSDGESNTGRDPVRASQAAAASGVRIDAIAFGTPDGEVGGQRVGVGLGELTEITDASNGTLAQAATRDELERTFSTLASALVPTLRYSSLSHLFALAAFFVLMGGAGVVWWRGGRLP